MEGSWLLPLAPSVSCRLPFFFLSWEKAGLFKSLAQDCGIPHSVKLKRSDLPTGRSLGGITQKEIEKNWNGRRNQVPIVGQILQEPNSSKACFLLFQL
jgi:hypothetical protein